MSAGAVTGWRSREGWSLWRLAPAVWRLRHPELLPTPRYLPSMHLALQVARRISATAGAR